MSYQIGRIVATCKEYLYQNIKRVTSVQRLAQQNVLTVGYVLKTANTIELGAAQRESLILFFNRTEPIYMHSAGVCNLRHQIGRIIFVI